MAKMRASVNASGKTTYKLAMGPKEAATLFQLLGAISPGSVKNVKGIYNAVKTTISQEHAFEAPEIGFYFPLAAAVPANLEIENRCREEAQALGGNGLVGNRAE